MVGQGGALMISHTSQLVIDFCQFTENTAQPLNGVSPLTYSGTGGALFVQSSAANITNSYFHNNFALTGIRYLNK